LSTIFEKKLIFFLKIFYHPPSILAHSSPFLYYFKKNPPKFEKIRLNSAPQGAKVTKKNEEKTLFEKRLTQRRKVAKERKGGRGGKRKEGYTYLYYRRNPFKTSRLCALAP
jgi:hypothetical protein